MASYPHGLPHSLRPHWRRPWGVRARHSKAFHRWLDDHNRLSPHFWKHEAACHDGTPVPGQLVKGARRHAFNLERLRHKIGDRPVRIISWYRTPEYNYRVGGAAKSWHVQAVATDHPVEWVRAIPNFDRKAGRIFRHGGFGQYPGGARHTDSRGFRARWTSYVPANRK